jgi:subtilisin family serine protease
MDCDGHGTHVAGILAAAKGDMGMIGAAPGVTLGAYRVFGCKGGVGDDILIAAFNKAYEDGADIITASIGGANGWPHGPWIDTVSRIVEKGIPCTLSAGNDGMRGLFLTGGAAAGYGATSVTSFDNVIQGTEYDEAYYQLNGGSRVGIPFRFYEDGRYKPDFDGVSRPVYVPESDACQELPKDSPDLSNYNVLLAFADCGAEIQAENIFAKGGRTISFYYDGEGLDPRGIGYWTFASPKAFKFITFLQFEAAKTFQRALNSGYNVSIEFPHPDNGNRNMVFLPNTQTPGAVSEASSWGPTYEVSIKPQFGAPGGYILSTFLNESYALKSGTSMATPLVAGAYALIAEARATLDPAIIQSLLSATSKQQSFLDPYEGGYQDYLAPPMQQGNGIIQVYDALQLTSSLKPTSLSFNDTAHFTQTVNFTISNEGRKDITYEISHVPVTHSFNTLQENSVAHEFAPYSPAKGHAEIEFSSSKVTLSPGGSATISVTATPPKGLDIIRYPIWSGYITLNGSDATSLSLPYLGVEGSLYSATYFDEEGVKMYSTDSLDDNPLYNHTFTVPAPGKPIPEDIQSAKLPLFWARNLWGVPLVYADLVPVASCSNLTRAATGSRPIGQIMGFPKRWVPEKSMDEIFVGQLGNGDYAPPGRYKVVMRALRIFGDEKNDNDWIVKETQSFGIRYGS